MIFSMKRMNAIFTKDMKDLSKNMYILTTLLMPIVLAAIFGRTDEGSIQMSYMVINLTFTLVAAFVQASIIAEEKEKNTLRGLMLSPASTFEILCGKSLVSFIMTIVTIVICSIFVGYEPSNFLIVSVAIILSSIFYIAIGTLLGLLTNSVMEASIVVLPVMILFGFGSFILTFKEKYEFLSVIEYLPSIQLEQIAFQVEQGAGLADVWSPFAIIAVWVVVSLVLVVMVYQKRRVDD